MVRYVTLQHERQHADATIDLDLRSPRRTITTRKG